MNWQEIKEKYPKAFSLLDKSVDIHWELEPERYQRLRFLYDFFDEQGISITVDWSHSEVDGSPEWFYEITDFGFPAGIEDVGDGVKTRIEAEEAAFNKAFSILESKL